MPALLPFDEAGAARLRRPKLPAARIEGRRLAHWIAALLAALIALHALSGRPAAAQTVTQDARTGAVMTVPINKSQVLKLDRPFARAMIGNPEIADVMPLNVNSVYVLGRAAGSTNLALYDRRGDLIAVVDVVVGPDVVGLRRQIADIFPGEEVKITNSADSLVIEGRLSGPMVAERVMALAETHAPQKVVNMMSVGSPQQVLLEVRVSEMQRGVVKQLGISSFSWGTNTSPTAGLVQRSTVVTEGPFQAAFNLLAPNINIQLEALERRGLVRTLAQPNLVALSGETASFLAGGEFPIPVGVTQSGQISIEFKQFGVSLAFTPTVLDDGLINLRVAPEVSSIDRDISVILQNIVIPGLKVRRALTSLELRDGQSFAMAGLIQSDFTDTVRAVPLPGRIPIIGALFRSSSFQKNETELVITVTPRLVRPVHPSEIAVPTDFVLPPTPAELFLLGRTERRGTPPPAVSRQPGGPSTDHGHIVR
jgi:pilus assembly protein CpaC